MVEERKKAYNTISSLLIVTSGTDTWKLANFFHEILKN